VVGETSRLVLVAAGASSNSFDKVLVAIDFSEPSHRAVEAAMKLFPRAELHLVHAYGVPYRAFLPSEDVKDDIRAEHAELLDQALNVHETAFLDALGGDLRERCVLRQGETVSVIAKEARELGVDLLVIGASGRGGLFARPLGRVARALLEDTPCHVLAV
jgi:nucleotide-binding universal stress UspA family protein